MEMESKMNVINEYLALKIQNHRLSWLMDNSLTYLHDMKSCALNAMTHESLLDEEGNEHPYVQQVFKVVYDNDSYSILVVHLFDFNYDIYFKDSYEVEYNDMMGIQLSHGYPSDEEKNIHQFLMEFNEEYEKDYFAVLVDIGIFSS